MINELIKLSNHLDKNGYTKEANYLDAVIKKHAFPRNPFERRRGGSIANAAKRAQLEINIIRGGLNDLLHDLKENNNCKSYDRIMKVRAALDPSTTLAETSFTYTACEGGELHRTPDAAAVPEGDEPVPSDLPVVVQPPEGSK